MQKKSCTVAHAGTKTEAAAKLSITVTKLRNWKPWPSQHCLSTTYCYPSLLFCLALLSILWTLINTQLNAAMRRCQMATIFNLFEFSLLTVCLFRDDEMNNKTGNWRHHAILRNCYCTKIINDLVLPWQ